MGLTGPTTLLMISQSSKVLIVNRKLHTGNMTFFAFCCCSSGCMYVDCASGRSETLGGLCVRYLMHPTFKDAENEQASVLQDAAFFHLRDFRGPPSIEDKRHAIKKIQVGRGGGAGIPCYRTCIPTSQPSSLTSSSRFAHFSIYMWVPTAALAHARPFCSG